MAVLAGRYALQTMLEATSRDSLSARTGSSSLNAGRGENDTEDVAGAAAASACPVTALLGKTVVLTSPLIRAVDTAAHFCTGFEARAATALRRSATASVVRLPVHAEPAMIEPSFWMTQDLQGGGVTRSAPFKGPVHLTSGELAAAVSDRLTPMAGSSSYVPLHTVPHYSDANTGGFGEQVPTAKRFAEAAGRLVHGSAHLDGKVVVLVGHGESTVRMYNSVLDALGDAARGVGHHRGSPGYTGIAMLHLAPATGRYVELVRPFGTPHLEEA